MQRHVDINMYCRFCAELKPCTDISTVTSPENLESLIKKLSLFGTVIVDLTNKLLPETVCIACYDMLNVSYEFFEKVKRSQVFLSKLCGAENDAENFEDAEEIKKECDEEKCEDLSFRDGDITLIPLKKENNNQERDSFGSDGSKNATEDNAPNSEDTERLMPDVSLTTEAVPRRPDDSLTWATYPWQCAICGSNESSLKTLREHCRNVHLKCFAFGCADCYEYLDGFDDFVTHVRGHRKVLKNYCEYCNIRMEDRSHPDSHLIDECCTFCGDTFEDPTSLNTHLEEYAATPTGLLAFNVEIMEVSDDLIRNWAEYPAVCQFCNIKLIDQQFLSDHCVEVHKKCFGNKCVDCGMNIDCFKDFLKHVKTHRPYLRNICPYCNVIMTEDDMNHVEDHTANGHPCGVCGEIFERKRYMRSHQFKVQPSPLIPKKKPRNGPPNDNDTTCELCGTVMKTRETLKTHLKKHEDRKRDYICDRCGKKYLTKNSLDQHKKTHDEIVKEACEICHKYFQSGLKMKRHVETHNVEMSMPYQCDFCKRFFRSKTLMRNHISSSHMDIMRYKCRFCDKKSRFLSVIRIHENQHTGARPYNCDICGMDFANWSNCNKHMKRKHGKSMSKTVRTPHGKLPVNPKTGKPDLNMDSVKEWSKKILMSRDRRKKNTSAETSENLQALRKRSTQ